MQASEAIEFWRQAGPQAWFKRDHGFDASFDSRFRDAHFSAARGELEHWMRSAEGALALLILLDQFPRNCFRGSAHSYATDGLARHYAQRALDAGFDQQYPPDLRAFFYLPFEHSEAMHDQQHSLALFTALDEGTYQRYAQLHLDIIQRFGRFPHRNAALGRESTVEEQEFLAGGGFSG